MVSAPVGWQCPTCLKGAPPVRRMRDVQAGAFLVGGRPYVTLTLVAACVAAYIGQETTDITGRGSLSAATVAQGEAWRVVTSGFLHVNLIHLAFNMLILYQLGSVLEARLGKVRFVGLYALSLIGGSIGALLLQSPTTSAIGASGAVFGLMGVTVVQARRGRSPIESSVGGLLVVNLVITFALPGIAIGAHLGGLVAGALGGLLVRFVGEEADLLRVVMTTAIAAILALALYGAAQPVAENRCGGERQSALNPAELNRLSRQQLAEAYARAGRLCP